MRDNSGPGEAFSPQTMAHAQPLVVPATDGFPLGATLWTPAAVPSSAHAVVVNAGAGIPARYYERFAAWLADRGAPTLTYDYRGIGASRPVNLKGFEATVEDWGSKDCAAILDAMRARFPSSMLAVLGHSIGGFVAGLAPRGEHVDRLALVGAHTGHWRDYAPRVRLPMYLPWHVAMPLLARFAGYFPGRPFGLPSDLPAGVARDWARRRRSEFWWYLKRPDGSPDTERIADVVARFDAFRAKALIVSVSDDPFATGEATARIVALFRNCRFDERCLDPATLGLPKVGHFGFFRSRMRETLWPVVGDFLVA